MAGDDLAFVGSVPDDYDRFLGPALFEPYARDLAARVAAQPSTRLLELACGTGRLTNLLAGQLAADQHLTATDLSDAMLAKARSIVGDRPGVTWRAADAATLPFDDASFDALVFQFGLMFVPDKAKAMRECRRVLVPGGRLLLYVWDSIDTNPAAAIYFATVTALMPDDPPMLFQVPHSMHDPAFLATLAHDAGFVDVEVHAVALECETANARDIARGYVYGTPAHQHLLAKSPVPLEELVDRIELGLAAEFGDHPFRCPLRAFLLEARVPG